MRIALMVFAAGFMVGCATPGGRYHECMVAFTQHQRPRNDDSTTFRREAMLYCRESSHYWPEAADKLKSARRFWLCIQRRGAHKFCTETSGYSGELLDAE